MNVDKLNINIIKNETYYESYTPTPNDINNRYVTIYFDQLDLGIYQIETSIDGNRPFRNDSLKFRVISKMTNFSFNHYYFALNDNDQNYLIITVNDNSNTFACIIEEDDKKQKLDDKHKNCKTFYYKINRTGRIKFNYYNNETDINITIPIDKTINVYSSYIDFFYFPSF